MSTLATNVELGKLDDQLRKILVPDVREYLGANIRILMATKDCGLTELSKKAHLHTSYISRLCKGENVNFSFQAIHSIAAALETDVVALLSCNLTLEIRTILKQ